MITDKQLAMLQYLWTDWTYAGEPHKVRPIRGQRWTAPRTLLKGLIALGLVEVRTVNVSNWKCRPAIKDRQGAYVEARLTDQGSEVRLSFTGRVIDLEPYQWFGEEWLL